MPVLSAFIPSIFDSTPVVRTIWRAILERPMEITITRDSGFVLTYSNTDQFGYQWRAMMHGLCTLRFVNHRTDRKERIIGASLALKRRRLLLWRETILVLPVRYCGLGSGKDDQPITDIELEPQSAPVVVRVRLGTQIPDDSVYAKKMEMVLELETVGPMRVVRRSLGWWTHKREAPRRGLPVLCAGRHKPTGTRPCV